MANYQHLPLPDSFPDFSCYSQAFDEFAALDYNQDVIYEYQPVTPENQLTKATPSVVGNQIDVSASIPYNWRLIDDRNPRLQNLVPVTMFQIVPKSTHKMIPLTCHLLSILISQ